MGNEINCDVCNTCLHESNRRKIFTDEIKRKEE